MTINNKTLENLSKLSKIKIDDNLRDKLKEDLNLTMNMIDKINKIDCDQIEELSHPIKDNFNLREDKVSRDINRESLQKTSNKTEGTYRNFVNVDEDWNRIHHYLKLLTQRELLLLGYLLSLLLHTRQYLNVMLKFLQ